jgi:hypothetical protein
LQWRVWIQIPSVLLSSQSFFLFFFFFFFFKKKNSFFLAKLMAETSTPSSAETGRSKSEVQITCVRLGKQLVGVVPSAQKKQKKDVVVPEKDIKVEPMVEPVVVAPPVEEPVEEEEEGPFKFEFVKPSHKTEFDLKFRSLKNHSKVGPDFESFGFSKRSLAYAIASNDFGVSTFDTCFCKEGRRNVAADFNLKELGNALIFNTRLSCFNAPFSCLTDKDMTSLFGPSAEAKHELGITRLDLRNNKITRASGALLASIVGLCPHLQVLRLANNDLGEADLIAIVNALSPNMCFLELTHSTDKVVEALGARLKQLPNLFDLRLTRGSVSDTGITALGEGLRACKSSKCRVAHLDISHNNIKDHSALVYMLYRLGSMWWIQGEGNPFSSCSTMLRDCAREKFRALRGADLYPVLELQKTLVNSLKYTSVTSQKTLETICSCLSVGLDLKDAFVGLPTSPLEHCGNNFGDGRVMELLVQSAQGPEAVQALDEKGRNLLMMAPSMSPENLRVLLETGLPLGPAEGRPCLVGVGTYAWTKGKGVDPNGWLHRITLLLNMNLLNIEAEDGDGETALSVFSRSGYTDVVQLLISRGAKLSKKDKSYQNTCLHWACQYGQPGIVRIFLNSKEGDMLVEAKNVFGKTALDLCKKYAMATCELELKAKLKRAKK